MTDMILQIPHISRTQHPPSESLMFRLHLRYSMESQMTTSSGGRRGAWSRSLETKVAARWHRARLSLYVGRGPPFSGFPSDPIQSCV